jgi:hypothetical protein
MRLKALVKKADIGSSSHLTTNPSFASRATLIGYKVYRGGVAITDVLTDLTYRDYDVSYQETYTYHVSAVYNNPVEESVYSNDFSITVMPGVYNPPRNLQASSATGGVNLTWLAPLSNHTGTLLGYHIYKNETLLPGIVETLSFSDFSVTSGTSYTYNVTAVYILPSGESEFSNNANATPVASSFMPPRNLSATAGNQQVTLNWQAPTSIAQGLLVGYRIYKDNELIPDLISELSYLDADLDNDTPYQYYVTAVYENPAGESGASNIAYATPTSHIFNPPKNITSSVRNEMISLSWQVPDSGSSGILSGYRLYRNFEPITNTINMTTYNDTHIKIGRAHV